MRPLALLALLTLPTIACGTRDSTADSAAASAAPATDTGATTGTTTAAGPAAEMRDASGRSLGTVTLAAAPTGIALSGHLTGLPVGEHGIHLHAVGQCAPPFETAGPHWNPTGRRHGSENAQGPHQGDLPNVTVAADSSAHVSLTTPAGALDSLLDADGASIVVHEKADDYRTDPSGNSGGRIACGVITRG